MANQKDIQIRRLYEKGHSTGEIARLIGYGGAMEEGLKRVKKGLKRLGLMK